MGEEVGERDVMKRHMRRRGGREGEGWDEEMGERDG